MKRGTFALLALLVAASLVATGGRATAERQLRVGFVTYSGVVPSNRSIEGQMLLGFLRADKELAIQGRVQYVPPNQDPTGPLQYLARQNYDLIVVAFPGSPDALERIGKRFPRVRFVLPDVPIEEFVHRPKNFQGSFYRAEEAAYLAGYLAALMEGRRPGKHVISAVGGIPYSGVARWIVGYKAGAKKADPAISVLIGYSNDFANPAKCRRVALSQIAKGSGAVFNVAGTCGLGTLRAVKDEGVWGLGVDIDQSYLGPQILASAILRLDRGVFNAIRSLVRGSFKTGGNSVFNLRNGGVELGGISPLVPGAFLRRVESTRQAIVDGRIRVPRAG
jgi:basic membrane protein A and related proteins